MSGHVVIKNTRLLSRCWLTWGHITWECDSWQLRHRMDTQIEPKGPFMFQFFFDTDGSHIVILTSDVKAFPNYIDYLSSQCTQWLPAWQRLIFMSLMCFSNLKNSAHLIFVHSEMITLFSLGGCNDDELCMKVPHFKTESVKTSQSCCGERNISSHVKSCFWRHDVQ